MAKSANVTIEQETWTLLSDSAGAIAAATLANIGRNTVYILATASNSAPSGGVSGIPFMPDTAIKSSDSLADIFPGVSAGYYLWGYSRHDSEIYISHA